MLPNVNRLHFRVPLDVAQVAFTAEALQIAEVDVFRHAHCSWYGREVDESSLDGAFGAYLMAYRVPPWVRHFCRAVLADVAAGRLDPKTFGVYRPTVPRINRREQLITAAISSLTFVVYLVFFV